MDRKVYSAAAIGAIAALALIASVAVSIAVTQCKTARVEDAIESARGAAQAAKEKAADEIEATPAGDLVAGSHRADDLERARESRVDEFSRRSVDRIREILRRDDGTGSP